MRVCVLYLSVLTLLQLHSRFVMSAFNMWLPQVDRLSSIIQSCEHALNYEVGQGRPLAALISNPAKSDSVNVNTKVSVNKAAGSEASIQTSQNVNVNLSPGRPARLSDDIIRDSLLPLALRTQNVKVGDQSMNNFNLGLAKRRLRSKYVRSPSYFASQPVSPIKNVVTINNGNKEEANIAARSKPVDINVGHLNAKNFNNVHDHGLSIKGRTQPTGYLFLQKRKFDDMASCVKQTLLKIYDEEVAFFNRK